MNLAPFGRTFSQKWKFLYYRVKSKTEILSVFCSKTANTGFLSYMESMSLEESCGYIDHHTKIAGRPNAIFSDEAKSDIQRKAEGIPRRINAICFRSILNATLNELNIIDSSNLVLEDPTD